MSQLINIRRDVKDSYYRYKMPKLVSKIEGKGNGIKTVVSNMVDIAKALNRPPAYVTKFFGSELGSLSICDEKAARYIVNGAHEAEKLQNLLDGFITKFVLCQACENPETDLSVVRDGTIYRSCKACGARSTVDMIHKLCTYIQKNPPPKPKKLVKTADEKIAENSAAAAAEPEEATEGMTAPEGIETGFVRASHGFREDDDDWAEVEGDEADAALAAKLNRVKLRGDKSSSSSAQRLAASIEALEAFGTWLDANGAASSNEQLDAEIAERDIRPDRAVVALVQCLLKAEGLTPTLSQRAPLLLQLISASRNGKGVRAFLGSLERLVAIHHPVLLPQIPAILQAAYQMDLIDEDDIMTWFDAPKNRFVPEEAALRVRKSAEPFVTWLSSADSDEDEDEDEDDSDSEE